MTGLLLACGPQVDADGNLVERPPERTPADRFYYCAGLLTGIAERGETARWLDGEADLTAMIERLDAAAQNELRQAGLTEWDADVRTGRYRTARADLAIQMPAVEPETCVREAEALSTARRN